MKLPSLYKKQYLGTTLSVSILAHLVLFGVGGFLSPSPEVNVRRAENSIEVRLIQETPRPKPIPKPIKREKVMTTKDVKVPEKVVQKKEPVKEQVKPKKVVQKAKPKPLPKPVKTQKREQGAIVEKAMPDYLSNPAPKYPSLARREGWEGVVLLDVFVEASGKPADVRLSKTSGHEVLDRAALKVVKKWKFKPARVGNRPYGSRIKIPIRFVLKEA